MALTEFERLALKQFAAMREELHGIHALLANEYAGVDLDDEAAACPNCQSTNLEDTSELSSPNKRVTCLSCGTSQHTPKEALHG